MTKSAGSGGFAPGRTSTTRSESPITLAALAFTTAMALGSYLLALAGHVHFASLPNPLPLIFAGLVIDFVAGLTRGSRITCATRTAVFAILYLCLASIAGILAAYAGQRLQMPLRDDLFIELDRVIGFEWTTVTRWIDRHSLLADLLRASYATMPAQIILPAVVLAFTGEHHRLRVYLLSFSIALAITAAVSACVPALSPIASIEREWYHVLKFTGATPLHHLAKLRAAAPAIIDGDLGGIISFPSFHATVAVLTPIALGRYRIAVAILAPVDALMLCAAISEGAHYASDVVAGMGVAVLAYAASGYAEKDVRRCELGLVEAVSQPARPVDGVVCA